MKVRLEDWVLSCGHIRALGPNEGSGGNQSGDDARCYECPARKYPSGQRIAPMRKLDRLARPK